MAQLPPPPRTTLGALTLAGAMILALALFQPTPPDVVPGVSAPPVTAGATAHATAQPAPMVLPTGSVETTTALAKPWLPVRGPVRLEPGSHLRTTTSATSIVELVGNSRIHLSPSSHVAGVNATTVALLEGQLEVDAVAPLTIGTAHSLISVTSAHFKLETTAGNGTSIEVTRGHVSVHNTLTGFVTRLKSGQSLSIGRAALEPPARGTSPATTDARTASHSTSGR